MSPSKAGALCFASLAVGWTAVGAALQPARSAVQDPERRAPVELVPERSCVTSECHADTTKGRFVHGPVAVLKCDVCHVQPDPEKHEFAPLPGAAAGCTTCHELSRREHVHQPFAEGNCTGCHDPHRSESRALLKTAVEADTCAQCHDATQFRGKRFLHGPVAAGACTLCHNAHSSYYGKLLDKKGSQACLVCHTEMEETLRLAQHTHRPVSEDCSQCHDPHNSDHPYQLLDEPRTMCLDCHQAKREEIESATVFHEALTGPEGCKSCHRTHGSRFPKLLDKPVMELCLDCHREPQMRPDGTVVAAVGRELSESKYLHGPIREGDCSSCHNPHGSKNFQLLRESYPERFYAPFEISTYTLCFRCHDARVFTTPRTSTLTSFRNGDVNLHYLHVNKETKGRTCRACHKTHASNLPQHMAEKVPFGGWEIPINYQDRATGGSCAPGCHQARAYDYESALPDYKLPESK